MVSYNSCLKRHIAELCKGSTSDSDSLCSGSNPDSAAKASYMMPFIFYKKQNTPGIEACFAFGGLPL